MTSAGAGSERAELFSTAQILIVAGKGGVGKTTAASSLAIAAARTGRPVLLVEVEGRDDLARLLGCGPLTATPQDCGGGLSVATISAEDAAADYLRDNGMGMALALLRRAGSLLETLTTWTPGLRGLLQLAKIKQLAILDPARMIIVDAPAAGHALSFLRSPSGVQAAVDQGPIRAQADDVLELLADGDRVQVILATLLEETPVTETVDTAFALEEDLGVRLGPLVVNAMLTPLDGLATDPGHAADEVDVKLGPKAQRVLAEAAALRLARQTAQAEQLERLSAELPLAQWHLPALEVDRLTRPDLDGLADLVVEQPA